ncbi:MAG: oligosaccharyl transferase, archaeosortase A system-associated [Chloroflexota bacterium]|nr:MAG: oligosaccharyl transferase, archaeosortase A system-associated [Chloroflexota bacterium]
MQQIEKNRNNLPIIIGISLAILFVLALCLRFGFVIDKVFVDDYVKFAGTDAYYHMRLVENMSHNFPERITFDPYTYYPHGAQTPWPPLFDWLIIGIAWIFSLGALSQHALETVGAWLPAILGAATVIPVYFIGKALLNHWVGLLSAALIAIHPGGFLTRSLLGFCDHHAAETLFSTLTMLFLILGLKSAKDRGLTFDKLRWQNLPSIGKPVLYYLLSGLLLGAYLLTWSGGLLLILVLFTYFIAQSIIDHLRGKSIDYLVIAALPLFIIGGTISLPSLTKLWTGHWFMLALPIAILTPVILNVISRLLVKIKLARIYYPVILVGIGLAGLATLWIFSPDLLKSLLNAFNYIFPRQATMDIWEAQPLLFPFGKFSLSFVWSQYTTGFLLSLISMGIITYSAIKQDRVEKVLLLVWSFMMLLAVMGQSRYGYYFAVNVALLTGYLSWHIIQFFSPKETNSKPAEISGKISKKKAARRKLQQSSAGSSKGWPKIILGTAIVLLLVFVPNITEATKYAKQLPLSPDYVWHESLSWMRDNTPDPFDNPDFYYEIYEPPAPGEDYSYPDSAYGVMVWWQYGHWVTQIAHRIPTANPFQQGAQTAAQFLTAQDEASANAILDKLGVRYVFVDEMIATGFFGTATWAGLNETDFYDVYYAQQGGALMRTTFYHPEYYRSMCVRLYNFDGKEIVPDECMVISYEEKTGQDDTKYKQITSSRTFSTYEEAEEYIFTQKSAEHKIVSRNPFISPVPLDELKHYRPAYASETESMQAGVGMVPVLKIFEFEK